jgi:5-methylthioribose kinase
VVADYLVSFLDIPFLEVSLHMTEEVLPMTSSKSETLVTLVLESLNYVPHLVSEVVFMGVIMTVLFMGDRGSLSKVSALPNREGFSNIIVDSVLYNNGRYLFYINDDFIYCKLFLFD